MGDGKQEYLPVVVEVSADDTHTRPNTPRHVLGGNAIDLRDLGGGSRRALDADVVEAEIVQVESSPVAEVDYIDAEFVPEPGPFAAGVVVAADTFTSALLGGVARGIDDIFGE